METISLEKILVKYLIGSEQNKKEIDSQINEAWSKLSEKYEKACNCDQQYCEVFERIKELHHIMDFNVYDYYSRTIYVEEFDDYNQEFDKKTYENHKYIYENQDALLLKISRELEKLRTSKIVFNRANRIKELEDKLAYYNHAIEKYSYYIEMKNKQTEYKENYETMVKPLEDEYKNILLAHGQTVLKEALEETPVIICKKNTTINGCLTGTQGKVLNGIVNDLHDNLMNRVQIQSDKINVKR